MAPTKPVYLDHNATTPVRAEVVEAMLPMFREDFGNPSSVHACGGVPRMRREEARAKVAARSDANIEYGQVTGTPSFFVNGRRLTGALSLENFDTAIAAAGG